MKAAIKLFCLECVGGEKAKVASCTDHGCPLYPVRPYRTGSELAAQAAKERTPAQLEAARQAGARLVALRAARAQTKKPSLVSPPESFERPFSGNSTFGAKERP
jgi:hypothetical protein